MSEKASWDWQPGEKKIDFGDWESRFQWVEEPYLSPDGERLAAIVNIEEGVFNVCTNGELWEEDGFDKIWHLRFVPDGRIVAFVAEMGEWTLAVDGQPWEARFDYIWDLHCPKAANSLGACVQNGMKYGIAVDGAAWDERFANLTDAVLSDDGRHNAATVQMETIDGADIEAFQKGLYTVAVDGVPWASRYVNVWHKVFNGDGSRLAAEVRNGLYDYTICVDGQCWARTYGGVWTPVFEPGTDAVLAPVREGGKWHLAKDGERFWDADFFQLWQLQFNPAADKLAAIASPSYGKWTVVVDGKCWETRVDRLITELTFSPDGRRIGAVAKHKEQWRVLVDDKLWPGEYDMVYRPVFSPDGEHVAVKAEKDGRFLLLLDGKTVRDSGASHLWSPVFDPDGRRLLFGRIDNGTYIRTVMPVADLASTETSHE